MKTSTALCGLISGLLVLAAGALPTEAATIVINQEIDLTTINTTGNQIVRGVAIPTGPVSVSVGDTIQLNWTFANNQSLEVTGAAGSRFLGGLRPTPNISNTRDNQSVNFLGLSGDPINDPSVRGAVTGNLMDALFPEASTGFAAGEVIRFTGLEFQFDVTALSTDPNLYDTTRLVIRAGTSAGSFSVIPEPSRALLSLLGFGAVCLRRRRS